MYYSFDCHKLFPEERKKIRKETKEIDYLSYMDQLIFYKVKIRQKNVTMTMKKQKQMTWLCKNVKKWSESQKKS